LLVNGKDAWIIDPGDALPLISALSDNSLCLNGILLTHGHFDHIYGLNEIIAKFPCVKVYTNSDGFKMLMDEKKNLSHYHEIPFAFLYPENVQILDSEGYIGNIEILATPGHNPSCLTYIVDGKIFTGDSYIPNLKTVTNIPGGDKVLAQKSILRIKLKAMNMTIFPGHQLII
jgi:glyoxylase-like metal-dependent hydrolase (beta-lactamase superfamily II)